MNDTGILKKLPLEDLHIAAQARFGAFAGWSMPITYPAGVMKEHLYTRQKAGLFDISHMRLFEVEGSQAAALISRACPFDASALALNQSKYTFFLNAEAGIIDDLIVTRLGPERFILVANAGNAEADEEHLRALALDFDCSVKTLDRLFLALQGPAAEAALNAAGFDSEGLTFMHGVEPRDGWFMSRSGYTGEDGFEIALPEAEGRELAKRLLADERVAWVGLAARDSLRLEAGLCLHGQDISPDVDPAAARLMWAIPEELRQGGRFVGASPLKDRIARGPAEKRVGLKAEGRQPVRAGATLHDENGMEVGRVTSGGFGPSVGHPVAMGYVAAPLASTGTKVFAEVRGTKIPLSVHPLPFTPHRYRKG